MPSGSTTAKEINPAVLGAMVEIGLDLSTEFPERGRRRRAIRFDYPRGVWQAWREHHA